VQNNSLREDIPIKTHDSNKMTKKGCNSRNIGMMVNVQKKRLSLAHNGINSNIINRFGSRETEFETKQKSEN